MTKVKRNKYCVQKLTPLPNLNTMCFSICAYLDNFANPSVQEQLPNSYRGKYVGVSFLIQPALESWALSQDSGNLLFMPPTAEQNGCITLGKRVCFHVSMFSQRQGLLLTDFPSWLLHRLSSRLRVLKQKQQWHKFLGSWSQSDTKQKEGRVLPAAVAPPYFSRQGFL